MMSHRQWDVLRMRQHREMRAAEEEAEAPAQLGGDLDGVLIEVPLRVDTGVCTAGWSGCPEVYTHGHLCDRKWGHRGRHRCACGASSRMKAVP